MTLSRRNFLKAAIAGTLGAVVPFSMNKINSAEAGPADIAGHTISPSRATNEKISIIKPNVVPHHEIVDSHLHFLDFLEKSDGFSALCEAMDAAGVSKSVIFGMGIAKQWDDTMAETPSYYLSNDSRCYYYSGTDFLLAEELLSQPEEIRRRFFPFCCGINSNDRFAADHIRQLLKLYPNFWCGIGEIMSRHDDLTALTYGEAPHCNSKTFKKIYDLGAEYDLPVLIHHNITAQSTEKILYLDELKEALAYNRKCKIIWAHVGISRRIEIQGLTTIARNLLKENSNLWIDLSWVVYDYYIQDRFPTNYLDGDTMEDWVNLLEEFPDRFMIGSDKVGHWATYPMEIVKYYELVDKLQPETAAKVCRDNILSLIKKY